MNILLGIYFAMFCMWVTTQPHETVSLVSPAKGAKTSRNVTFKWAIKNPRPGVAYCSEVLIDKEGNPVDGGIEDGCGSFRTTTKVRTIRLFCKFAVLTQVDFPEIWLLKRHISLLPVVT